MDKPFVLPILYNIDKLGKERMWKIQATGNSVSRTQGLVGGKLQEYNRTFEGANVGKKNETSAVEQAKCNAESMWVKQLSKGYKPKCKEGLKLMNSVKEVSDKNGGHNTNASAAIRERHAKTIKEKNNCAAKSVDSQIKPMKASLLIDEKAPLPKPGCLQQKVLKYFNFNNGVYLQYKLDGWRCVARLQNDNVVLTTNNAKQYPWFSSLRKSIKDFIKDKDYLDGLDGELYCHSLIGENGELDSDERFSTISSMCGLARSNPHPLEDQICLVVFDLVDKSETIPYCERYKKLKALFRKNVNNRVVLCNTEKVYTPQCIFDYHDKVAALGYEGCMIRASEGVYTKSRSLYIRKYKKFLDEEFEVVGVQKDGGVGDENFAFVMKTKDGRTFGAKPVGTIKARMEMYKNAKNYKGKMMTIKFQEYSGDGVPRFPIARCVIREDQ